MLTSNHDQKHLLFYAALDGAAFRVPVERKATWTADAPSKLFDSRDFEVQRGLLSRRYDVSPDGRRFLMIKGSSTLEENFGSSFSAVEAWSLVPISHRRARDFGA